MIPILYASNETEFLNNGIGILRDAIDCDVEQVKNGEYEMKLVYPVRGAHFLSIRQRSILLCKVDTYSRLQPFRVYKISKPLNGKVTIYAQHIAYDMMGIPVAPFSAKGVQAALTTMQEKAAVDCPFTFSTDKTTDTTIKMEQPKAMWKVLGGEKGSILDTFGGEYEFDRWNVRLHSQRGENRGVRIAYGKNLTDFKQDENCAGCYTGVYPFWVDADNNLVQLDEKVVEAEGEFGYTRILTKDFTADFTEKPTKAQLRKRTKEYMEENDIGVPTVSWKISFVQLEQTAEYAGKGILEQMQLGDTVTVEFAEMGISATARVSEMVYKPLLERFDSVTLGSVRSGLADIIVNAKREAENKPTMGKVEAAIAVLTSIILGARGGAVRLLDTNNDGMPDTLYIADNADPTKAVKVWRFNYEGWGASKTGYNGPFIMGASLEAGLLADFITAGTLDANLVKVINLSAESIVSGIISADRIDIDNLVVKRLFSEGAGNAINVVNGCIDFYVEGRQVASLDRGIFTYMGDQVEEPSMGLNMFQLGYFFQNNKALFGMSLNGKGFAMVDDLYISGTGNCEWKYLEELGLSVLVKKS